MSWLLAQVGPGGLLQPGGGFGARDYAFFLATLVTVSAASSVAFIFAFVTRLGSVNFLTSARTKVSAAGFLLSTAFATVVQSWAVLKQAPTINTGDNTGEVGFLILSAHCVQAGFAVALLVLLILDVLASLRARG
jgi:hypothetical protein